MRLVIQRVSSAQVTVDGKVVGKIGKGLFILFGAGKGDDLTQVYAKHSQASLMAQKCVNLRIMADTQGKMNLDVQQASGEILVVSQFTLYADTSGGRRPSFINAAQPDLARELYEKFVAQLRAKGLKVETGKFGAYMEIESVADGPVTIILES